jgi:hypothetical protein
MKNVGIHKSLIFPTGTGQPLKRDSRVHLLSLISGKHTDLHHLNGERNEVKYFPPRVVGVRASQPMLCVEQNPIQKRVSKAPSVNVILGFVELDIKCHNWGIIVYYFRRKRLFLVTWRQRFDNGNHTCPKRQSPQNSRRDIWRFNRLSLKHLTTKSAEREREKKTARSRENFPRRRGHVVKG